MPNSIYDELFLHILEKYHNHSKWDNAEFKKIKTLSNTGVGSVGQDFIHELCNKLNINSKLSKKSLFNINEFENILLKFINNFNK